MITRKGSYEAQKERMAAKTKEQEKQPLTDKSKDYSSLKKMLMCEKPSDVSFKVCKFHEGDERCINRKKKFLHGKYHICASEVSLSKKCK